jgi:hypothetical protein
MWVAFVMSCGAAAGLAKGARTAAGTISSGYPLPLARVAFAANGSATSAASPMVPLPGAVAAYAVANAV